MPHGENLILVLEDHVPVRVLMKDIGEEAVILDAEAKIPEAVGRLAVSVPDELKVLSIFTDVFDGFFRYRRRFSTNRAACRSSASGSRSPTASPTTRPASRSCATSSPVTTCSPRNSPAPA